MNPLQAVISVLRNYANFEGRACRSEYWWFYLFFVVLLVAIFIASGRLAPGPAVRMGGLPRWHSARAHVRYGPPTARRGPVRPHGGSRFPALRRRPQAHPGPHAARHRGPQPLRTRPAAPRPRRYRHPGTPARPPDQSGAGCAPLPSGRQVPSLRLARSARAPRSAPTAAPLCSPNRPHGLPLARERVTVRALLIVPSPPERVTVRALQIVPSSPRERVPARAFLC